MTRLVKGADLPSAKLAGPVIVNTATAPLGNLAYSIGEYPRSDPEASPLDLRVVFKIEVKRYIMSGAEGGGFEPPGP